MKQLIEKNKKVFIVLLYIIIGIIVVAIKGFNVDIEYRQNYRIIVDANQEFKIKEAEEIANEVFGKDKAIVQVATKFNDHIVFTTEAISEENKTELVNKLNEKYALELTIEDLEIEKIPNVRIRDMIKTYIVPFIIITAILVIYVAIRFRKLNFIKAVLRFLLYIVFAEAIMFSTLAIFRIPIGKFMPSIIIITYILGSIIACKKEEDFYKWTKNKG